jgi:glycosyltransferase involved in cell wall biosynthesis
MGTQEILLKELASMLQIADQVIFLGNLPNEQLIEEVSRKKILLMASSQEGFPMAIAEAFSVGVPAIATDTGDISTFLKDGYNGALHQIEFNEEDYVKSIVQILNGYEPYAEHALASSRIFDAETITRNLTADIYHYLMSHAYSFHS